MNKSKLLLNSIPIIIGLVSLVVTVAVIFKLTTTNTEKIKQSADVTAQSDIYINNQTKSETVDEYVNVSTPDSTEVTSEPNGERQVNLLFYTAEYNSDKEVSIINENLNLVGNENTQKVIHLIANDFGNEFTYEDLGTYTDNGLTSDCYLLTFPSGEFVIYEYPDGSYALSSK